MTNPFSYPSNYMSIQLSQYRNQSFEELVAQAQKNQVDNAGQLSPAELVFLLVCQASSNYDGRPEIHADGLLEVLSDGYGFYVLQCLILILVRMTLCIAGTDSSIQLANRRLGSRNGSNTER